MNRHSKELICTGWIFICTGISIRDTCIFPPSLRIQLLSKVSCSFLVVMASSKVCAVECEISDSEYDVELLAPISEPKGRKPPRKIVWLKTVEFDTEKEAKCHVMSRSFSHWTTNRMKLDDRRSEKFYCQPYGKKCLAQMKYENVPGGTFIVYESKDSHDESLGVRQFGIPTSVKTKIDEVMQAGHLSQKLLTNKLQSIIDDVPTPQQLRNYVHYQNKLKSTPIVHIRDLKDWCHARITPKDDDDVFVVSHE